MFSECSQDSLKRFSGYLKDTLVGLVGPIGLVGLVGLMDFMGLLGLLGQACPVGFVGLVCATFHSQA